MADIGLILTMVAFFVICARYVSWCDRIIGPDPDPERATGGDLDAPEPVLHAEVPM